MNRHREMDVIEPKRLNSLGSFKINIKEYTDNQTPGYKTIKLEKQYGFTTIADFKREIWIHHEGDKEWSPNRIWVAQELEGGLYKPLDMTWTEQTTLSEGLPSPFDYSGEPDSRLVDHTGNRKAVYPLLNEGLLLEYIFKSEGSDPVTICIWTLESLIRKIGTDLEKPGVLNGYIQMYFPKIQTIKDAIESKDESYHVALEYIKQKNQRIEDINKFLGDKSLKKTEPFRLRHLRRWKGVVPKYEDSTKSLDILFYEFKISEDIPFLRYFPTRGHGEPLLKLATGLSGFPIISDKDMLASFLEEQPNLEFGAVMMAKIPFSTLSSEVRATKNVSLTIYWLEDGSCSITLEEPRKDMPLEPGVLEEAQILIKKALISVGYKEPLDINLAELSAAYRIEIASEKMNRAELLRRVTYFSPFLEESSYQEKSSSQVLLKWKAVNNYELEGAVFNYFTKHVFEDDSESSQEAKDHVQTYIRGAMDEFGRSEEDVKRLFENWYRRRTEIVPTGIDAQKAHNSGIDIEIQLAHPMYFLSFIGIDSEQTFSRLISIMSAYLYYRNKEVAEIVSAPPVAPVVNVVQVQPKQAIEVQRNMSWLNLLGEEEEEDEGAEAEAKAVAGEAVAGEAVAREAVVGKAPIDARNKTLEPLKEWYKSQLDMYDAKLFGYSQTDKSITVYSRTCQASSARQPNILVAEQLDALIKEYGDSVEWVFLPPPDDIILDVSSLSNKQLIDEMGKRGLKDIVDAKGKPTKKKAELLTIFEDFLCTEPGLQGQFCRIIRKKKETKDTDKPIWFVARAGSNPETPHYYICSEYWCVRDNKPLIPWEFKGKKTIHGFEKAQEACPFCGGTVLEDLKHPKMGETVIKRKGKPGKGEIHEIVGYMDNIHPNKFALPCCFTRPTIGQMNPASDTEALPKDKRINGVEEKSAVKEKNEDEADEEDKDILEDKDLTKILKTVRTQYVLGYEKRQLDAGKIGLCPPALDEILGQIGSQSVMKQVGVAQHFNSSAKVFVRFGLGNKGSSPGLSFLELLGFYMGNLQRAGKPPTKGAKLEIPTVYTAAAVVKLLFPVIQDKKGDDKKSDDMKFLVNFRRAFERANYGNLIHEFAGNSDNLTTSEFQKFANEQGFNFTTNPSIRPHVVRFANAWSNFMKYVKDESSPKELKHFDNLFACPNVIFPNGLIPILFEGTTDESGEQKVKVKCPEYGISEFSKSYKPPLALIWYDRNSNVYEPIIYIEAIGTKDKKEKQKYIVMTTFHEADPKYKNIDKSIQASMSDFIKQFLSFEEGCGRYENPPHPWMPDIKSSSVPRISNLLKLKYGPEGEPDAILRDRSNRLVGILFKNSSQDMPMYIPALEDGSLGLQLKSLYDTQSLPMPQLDNILNLLTNPKSPLSKIPGLKPSGLLFKEKGHQFCALRLQSLAIIPFSPFSTDVVNPHPVFIELMKKGKGAQPIVMLPWLEDIRFLSSGYEVSDGAMDVVKDAVVEEAYNYLRISLSAWLATKDGNSTLKQLKALRNAKLPLYELRRRGDILLEPLIHNWLDVSAHNTVIPSLSLLRRNCRVEKTEQSCSTTPMCSWLGNQCKIHTGTSEGVPDIKVYFTSRIIDEIMRYSGPSSEILENSVSMIRAPLGIVRTKDSILTSKSKIQELVTDLDLNYVPKDDYSAGLTYPEDVHDDDMGKLLRPEFIDIPADWRKAGLSRIRFDPVIDSSSRLKVSLIQWTGETFDKIKTKILAVRKKKSLKQDDPINWSDIDWWCFSSAYETDILITRYDYEYDTSRIHKWIKSEKTKNYAVVFYVDAPEMLQSSKKPLISNHLPKIFQTYFDSATPTTWDLIKPKA